MLAASRVHRDGKWVIQKYIGKVLGGGRWLIRWGGWLVRCGEEVVSKVGGGGGGGVSKVGDHDM